MHASFRTAGTVFREPLQPPRQARAAILKALAAPRQARVAISSAPAAPGQAPEFKELEFKELEIHRYSLMDTINEYQWISINEYQWISINEFIDGPSMNMVPFLWAPFFGPFFGPHGAAFGLYVICLGK